MCNNCFETKELPNRKPFLTEYYQILYYKCCHYYIFVFTKLRIKYCSFELKNIFHVYMLSFYVRMCRAGLYTPIGELQ